MKKNKNSHLDDLKNDFPNEEMNIDEAHDNEVSEETETDSEVDNEEADEAIDQFETLQEELNELKDAHLRLRAEYDNYRKRTLKEKSDLIKYGGEKTISGFLDIMDDLDLAIANIKKAETIEGIVEGVELIQSKFISTLKSQGVNAMVVIGEEFDPDKHEAVAMVPTEDKEQKGKIIDCIQTGYTLNDKVIRHPKVVVGQ
ncbi:nucleotide exchange factor GrpE [Porphyromonadaceae bacterium W3.11]|nr:nucleotide exchange factor GrpE [Porphyromonadaceae bacterium W3.11]